MKTIVGFILVVLWFFIKNYERRPGNQPVRPPQPVPVPKVDVPPQKTVLKKTENMASEKNINKNRPVAAAFTGSKDSINTKPSDTSVIHQDLFIDEQINEVAEKIRLKLGSSDGAREAFIYNEIFKRRV